MPNRQTDNSPYAAPFAQLATKLDYPLYIVTTAAGGERSGCLIGFATQCSIHPPRFLACISKKNHTYGVVSRATVLAVHVVEEKHKSLADLFGGETGDEVDKFARVSWHEEHGVPILDAFDRWFAGSIENRLDFGGDHMGFVLKPLVMAAEAKGEQLSFQQARDIEPGHAP